MKTKEIEKMMEGIKRNMHDPEVAHATEDALHLEFIRYVARKGPEPFASKAQLILEVDEWDFPRWCA